MPLPTGTRRTLDPVELEVQRQTGRRLIRDAWTYGALTVAGAAAWVAFHAHIPFQLAIAVLGPLAVQAGRSLNQWRNWRQTQPGGEWLHPDRLAAMQQEAVQALAEAAKASAWFTRILIACITIPSLLEVVVGLDRAVAVASVEPVAIRSGEWWRLLSGTYLHGSYYHFAGNMGALLVYGAILESKTSRLRLPLVYLMSAVGGSVLSVVIPPDVPSIGASGGVVGIIGYLFLFSRRQEVRFPALFRGATASVFVGLITAGALGFWYIDNPGHAGGALTGFVLAAFLVDPARTWGEEIPLPLVDFLGWVASAVLVAGAIVTVMSMVGLSLA
jgi:membrane associated rhomboid family serine protease